MLFCVAGAAHEARLAEAQSACEREAQRAQHAERQLSKAMIQLSASQQEVTRLQVLLKFSAPPYITHKRANISEQ